MLARNVTKDILVAQQKMLPEVQKMVAQHVLEQMDLVEGAKEAGGLPALVNTLTGVLNRATADRHAALARGAWSNSDPGWNAASLV
jgi:hypothetical protein